MLPGAGEMYLGFMKRGASLMALFFFIMFSSTWLQLGPLMFIAPVIWFYSFFDTLNLRAMPDDEFYAMEDNYIILPETAKQKAQLLQGKYRTVFALILIVVGISILWNNFFDMIDDVLPETLRILLENFGDFMPQLIVSVAIIALGFYLIRGKKHDLDEQEKNRFLDDKGGIL